MISSQNQDQLSPLLDQISSQLAEEQFPWQSPVPPQKDAWYALILAFKPFLNLALRGLRLFEPLLLGATTALNPRGIRNFSLSEK